MKYIDFYNYHKQPLFTAQDLRISGIDILPVQLSNWVKKKYLLKMKKGVYVFNERRSEIMLETISHFMYEPSYISLERVLSYYGLIPEIVYNTTAVTTRKTMTIKNELGIFIYRHLKKNLFFGYKPVRHKNNFYLLADKEKALLDYFYLNSAKINNKYDIKELRFNEEVLNEMNKNKLQKYLQVFNSRKLDKIYKLIFK